MATTREKLITVGFSFLSDTISRDGDVLLLEYALREFQRYARGVNVARALTAAEIAAGGLQGRPYPELLAPAKNQGAGIYPAAADIDGKENLYVGPCLDYWVDEANNLRIPVVIMCVAQRETRQRR